MPHSTLPSQLWRPRCPHCGKGTLFASLLKVADNCSACGFGLRDHDAGDGPVFFAITLIGFLAMGFASVVEYHYTPPLWLHALIWIPFTLLSCIFVLRGFKALLIALEYRLRQEREEP